MHHADARRDRIRRGADADRLAMHHDLAGISFIEAEEDRHQRRFPGAVLADDAVNGPVLDHEIDGAVRMNRPETLLDADEPDGRVAHRRGTGTAAPIIEPGTSGPTCSHAPSRCRP